MALLFLDQNKEASRFSSASSDTFVRIAPNNSCKNSIVWGTENNTIYFGYGNEINEDEVKKELVISKGFVGIGCTNPQYVLDIPLPTDVGSPTARIPLLNVADLFTIHNDLLRICKGTNETTKFDIDIPTSIHNHVGIGTSASNRYNCIVYGNSGSIELNELFIGTQLGSIKVHSKTLFVKDSIFENSIIIGKNINCKGVFNCDGTIHTNEDLYVKGSLTTENIIVHKHIETSELSVHSSVDISKDVSIGGDIICHGDISIGNQPIKQGVFLVDRDLQISSSKKLGIGTDPRCSLDVIGDTYIEGNLYSCARNDVGHRIKGNIEIDGKASILNSVDISGTVTIQNALHVGQEYKPSPLIVYGITHLSQTVYIHGLTYFDKGIQVGGTIRCMNSGSDKEPIIISQKGSIYLENGCLGVNVQKPMVTHTFHVNGSSKLNGTVEMTGPVKITDGITSCIDVSANNIVADRDITGNNIISKTDIYCTNKVTSKSIVVNDTVGIGIGNNYPKEKLHIVGNTLVEGNVYTHSIHTTNGNNIFNNGKVGISCNDPTALLDVRGSLRIQNRRYGVYEPIQEKKRLWQFIRIPSHAKNYTRFHMKFRGIISTSNSFETVYIEFSGTVNNPNTRLCTISGHLVDQNNKDMSVYRSIKFYSDPKTQDIVGYIQFQNYPRLGIEFDIEISNNQDIYEWKLIEDHLILKTYENRLIWNPLENPSQINKNDAICFERKVGIGELKPQYMLDVKKEARFQSHAYLQGETFMKSLYTKANTYTSTCTETACSILNKCRIGTNNDGNNERYGISYIPSHNVESRQIDNDTYYKTDELIALLVKAIQELSHTK